MKRILQLHSAYSPTNYIVDSALTKLETEVHTVRWDAQFIYKKTKYNYSIYTPPETKGLYIYERFDFKDADNLYELVEKLKPQVILVSGTMDKLYLKVCAKVKHNTNIPIICKSDAQYKGTIKDWIKIILSPIRYKKWFDYMFVPSYWQYEFARLLGFKRDKILLYNLCANIELFAQVNIEDKIKKYPKNFLFIGRFAPVKGLDKLIEAWRQIDDKKGWTLTFVGRGPLKTEIEKQPDIICLDHLEQEKLLELIQKSGCLVLPSLSDAHPLVLHEAAASGLPIVCSDVCGSIPNFVLNSYNGYTFSHKKTNDLKLKIEKIINLSEDELIEFSKNSRKLSNRITPEITAKTVLSVIEK